MIATVVIIVVFTTIADNGGRDSDNHGDEGGGYNGGHDGDNDNYSDDCNELIEIF